jgi:hypothetical protein
VATSTGLGPSGRDAPDAFGRHSSRCVRGELDQVGVSLTSMTASLTWSATWTWPVPTGLMLDSCGAAEAILAELSNARVSAWSTSSDQTVSTACGSRRGRRSCPAQEEGWRAIVPGGVSTPMSALASITTAALTTTCGQRKAAGVREVHEPVRNSGVPGRASDGTGRDRRSAHRPTAAAAWSRSARTWARPRAPDQLPGNGNGHVIRRILSDVASDAHCRLSFRPPQCYWGGGDTAARRARRCRAMTPESSQRACGSVARRISS